MMDLDAAIRRQWPGVLFAFRRRGDEIDWIEWSDGTPPTAAELDAAVADYRAARDAEASADQQERTQLQAARDTLIAYRDNPTPTNAQTAAVVRLLCRIALRWLRQMS